MKPSEVIDKAIEIIPTEAQWIQNALVDSDNRVCMAGALQRACGLEVEYLGSTTVSAISLDALGDYNLAKKFVEDVIVEIHPELSSKLVSTITIPRFNDSHEYQDIRSALEKARAKAQEAGE